METDTVHNRNRSIKSAIGWVKRLDNVASHLTKLLVFSNIAVVIGTVISAVYLQ